MAASAATRLQSAYLAGSVVAVVVAVVDVGMGIVTEGGCCFDSL